MLSDPLGWLERSEEARMVQWRDAAISGPGLADDASVTAVGRWQGFTAFVGLLRD